MRFIILIVFLVVNVEKLTGQWPCPRGWYRDDSLPTLCYALPQYYTQMYFSSASSTCQYYGSTLPMFKNQVEYSNFVKLVNNWNLKDLWLGLYRYNSSTSDASYSWISSPSYNRTFSYWDNKNEPNVGKDPQSQKYNRCVKTHDPGHNQSWQAVPCTDLHSTICQYRTQSICPPDNYGPYWQLDTVNSICYLFSGTYTTAQQAEYTCQNLYPGKLFASTLPVFRNMAEYDAFIPIARNKLAYSYSWVGASRPCAASPTSRSSFVWLNNTNITFEDEWKAQEPNNAQGIPGLQETCVCIDHSWTNLSWIDCTCQGYAYYFCQYRFGQPTVEVKFNTDVCLVPTYPSCQPPIANDHSNVTFSNSSYYIGTTATFACAPSYIMHGSSMLTCENTTNGTVQWTGTAPYCTYDYCNTLNPCRNNATCTNQNTTFVCSCATGYWGTKCENIDYCIIGPFNQNTPKRKKRQLDTALNELNNVFVLQNNSKNGNNAMNLQNGTINLASLFNTSLIASAYSLLNDTLDRIRLLAQVLPLQTTFNVTRDSCAPHGICISGLTAASCLCDDNYFGDKCQHRNCSAIPWSNWGDCIFTDCFAGKGIRNRTHIGIPDCFPLYDFANCSGRCRPPDPMTPKARLAATVSQSIGCSIIVGILVVTLILFAALREFTLERVLRMFQEITLLIGHSILLITMKYQPNGGSCSLVAIILQYTFLTNFTFLLLESLQTYCVLQNVISTGGFFSMKINLLIGLGGPFVLTLSTAMTMFQQYPSPFSCWVNIGHDISYMSFFPLVGLVVGSTILIEAAAMDDLPRLPLTPREKYLAAEISQKGAVFKIALNVFTWVFGMYSLYYQKIGLYGTLFAFNILFALVILLCHTLSDDRVIEGLKSLFCSKSK